MKKMGIRKEMKTRSLRKERKRGKVKLAGE
jgi:hypothetical protein